MLDSLEDDIVKGSLLFLEEKSKLMSKNGKFIKKFSKGEYCIYLGFSREIRVHLLLCGSEIFRINSFNLVSRTYIV